MIVIVVNIVSWPNVPFSGNPRTAKGPKIAPTPAILLHPCVEEEFRLSARECQSVSSSSGPVCDN